MQQRSERHSMDVARGMHIARAAGDAELVAAQHGCQSGVEQSEATNGVGSCPGPRRGSCCVTAKSSGEAFAGKRGQVPKTGTARRVLRIFGT
jgi:hypothetical protein